MKDVKPFLFVVNHLINAGNTASFIELSSVLRLHMKSEPIIAQKYVKLMVKRNDLRLEQINDAYYVTLTKQACDKVRALNERKRA